MKLAASVALAALGVAAAGTRRAWKTQPREGYTVTPIGWMREDCVHAVPSGATLSRTPAGVEVRDESGVHISTIPECPATKAAPLLLPTKMHDRTNSALRAGGAARELQLPADYKGWVQYANTTAPDMSTGYDAFTSIMTVPNSVPAQEPDVLYLFPAVQSIDWIPLVDPEPTGGAFDILQPVLQTPADNGEPWSVKSWWVTLDVGALYSNEIVVQPGDAIFGNMTRLSGGSAWFIDSVVQSTGKHTSIKATANQMGNNRLANQPWAYVTLECYGCESCATYPSGNSSSSFLDMVLTPVGSSTPVTPKWQINAKPDPNHFCNEKTVVSNPSNVTIYFNY